MSTLARLLQLMAPLRWWVALAVLLSFGTLGASVGLMAMSAYLISKAALVPAFADIAVVVTAVRFFAIARAALRYAERYVTHLVTFRILTHLRVWFYNAIEPLAPAHLQEYHSGDLFARIGADIETLENFYVRVVVPPLAAALVAAAAGILLGAFDVQLAVVLLAFMLLTGVVLPLVTQRLARAPSAHLVTARAELTATMTDQIHGAADIMAFGQQERFRTSASAAESSLERAQLELAQLRGLTGALAVLFASLAGLTILFIGIPLVTGGKIEGVLLALLPLTAIAAFEAVQPLSAAVQHLETGQAAANRLFALIDAPPAVKEPARPLPLPKTSSIEFFNVSFSYPSTASWQNEPLALDRVSFKITEGQKLAVIGASGAGKTTLVNLLLRFWELQGGQILVGGQDIRSFAADDLRTLIGVVSQHTFVFNGTLRDNLLLARGAASDAELSAACRTAQLEPFIHSLPNGFDTLVGENGLKLSGGERQRLAIARVILKDAPVVILDEATANLDAVTEQALMSALSSFMQNRTTLLISHRRAGFDGIQQIVELEQGRLREVEVPRMTEGREKITLPPV